MEKINLKSLLHSPNNLTEEELLELERCLWELGKLPHTHSLIKLIMLSCQQMNFGNKQISSDYELGKRDAMLYLRNLFNQFRR